jgi:REP element-mobilizing transposase RayT
MKYNPELHHRRSIRLPGYDYSQPGAYFVTVCTHNRDLLLESAAAQEAVLATWQELLTRFPTLALDEFVIMPNHVHGIVILGTGRSLRGAASRAPTSRVRPTLGEVVLAFKSLSAIKVNTILNRTGLRFWQRNYYEHVIRDEDELSRVRQYIRDNPLRWGEDPENPSNL